MRWPVLLLSLLIGGPLGCVTSPSLKVYPLSSQADGASLDYRGVLAAHPMEPGDDLQVIEIDRTRSASFHLVRVQTQEKPHYHARHEATAFLLEGAGTLHLTGKTISLQAGAVATIPRRVIHYFVSEADHPAVFYVIFNPPFDGKDRVRVQSVKDLLQ